MRSMPVGGDTPFGGDGSEQHEQRRSMVPCVLQQDATHAHLSAQQGPTNRPQLQLGQFGFSWIQT